jgi:hypothetical protein
MRLALRIFGAGLKRECVGSMNGGLLAVIRLYPLSHGPRQKNSHLFSINHALQHMSSLLAPKLVLTS